MADIQINMIGVQLGKTPLVVGNGEVKPGVVTTENAGNDDKKEK